MSSRRRAKAVVGIVLGAILVGIAATAASYVYYNRAELKRFFSNPPPPDAATIARAIDQAYGRIKPTEVTSSMGTVAGKTVPQDRVQIPKTASLLRANAEITEAVEKAGGEIAYGVESSDEKGRKVAVTLGIAIRKNLVREVRLERSTKK
jgi:hypothetical protein